MEPTATPNERADRLLGRILTALRHACAGRGAKFYANELGVGHTTLLHKLEPENPSDALTLRQFAMLLLLVEPGAVMRPLAAELGGQWFTIPPASRIGADVFRAMTEVGKEFGDISEALLAGTDPNGPGGAAWTDEECDRLDREVDEAAAKAREVVAVVRRNRAPGLTVHSGASRA